MTTLQTFVHNVSPMGTPKLTLKPKQCNSKIHTMSRLTSLFRRYYLSVPGTHCEALRFPFVLSSHSDTQKYLPGTGLSKALHLVSTPPPSKQCCRCIQQHVRGRSLAAPSPLGRYPAAVLEEWLNRPPTSKWLELSNGEGSGVSGGQDASAAQSRSQTEQQQMLLVVVVWPFYMNTDIASIYPKTILKSRVFKIFPTKYWM